MKKGLVAILFVGFAACTTKEKQWSQAEMNAKIDSALSAKMIDIKRLAREDLDTRMAIEVKAKTDSIMQARQQAHAHQAPPTERK